MCGINLTTLFFQYTRLWKPLHTCNCTSVWSITLHSKHPALGVKFIILLLVHCTSPHTMHLINAKATWKQIQWTHEGPRASKLGDKIHSNIWGPSQIQTPGHKEYYVSFTADHTRWMHLQILATKDNVFKAYQNIEAWAKLQFKIPWFEILQSNGGGEYLGKKFSQYLSSQGTKQWLTVHDTPKYNGISERLSWMVLEKMCIVLHLSKLPKNLWGP